MKLSDFRPIFLVNGILLIILAAAMLLPAFMDYIVGNRDWTLFTIAAVATGFVGGVLYLTNRGYSETLSLRQTFLFTATSYFVISGFAAVPIYLALPGIDFVDAVFEAVSGVTTTGSTVLVGLDSMPPGMLLWRALLNAFGGIGIVVMTLAILPTLQIGGMQLFRTESSDRMDKVLPRTTQIATTIAGVYCIMTLLCAFCYYVAGMNGFDAMCHAMATIATGGMGNYDASFGYFDSPFIEMIAVVFMCAGSLPLLLYYQAMKGNPEALWKDSQVRLFFGIIAGVTGLVVLWLMQHMDMGLLAALRHALFSVVTVISTTGFVTEDYSAWGTFPMTLFFMLLVVGGCTGSTTGGIKVFRYQIFYETTKAQVMRLLQPHGVFVPRYNRKPVPEEVSASVTSFFLLWAFIFMVLACIMASLGYDFLTSMSAVAQAMANVGPGLGSVVGPATNFANLSNEAKLLLSFAMILGRLELFTVIVLFSPYFWRN